MAVRPRPLGQENTHVEAVQGLSGNIGAYVDIEVDIREPVSKFREPWREPADGKGLRNGNDQALVSLHQRLGGHMYGGKGRCERR